MLAVGSTMAVVSAWRVIRYAPRLPGRTERFRRKALGAILLGALFLTSVGGVLAFQGRPASKGFPKTLGGPASARYAGGALLLLAVAGVFVGLTLIPSTERELKWRIDVEASSVALGTSLFFFYAYGTLDIVFPMPRFSQGVAVLTVLVSYVLAHAAVRLRYR